MIKMEENKYQRGKIYKIVSNVSNLVYYGSTIEHTLAMRLSKHRSNYKRYQEGKCSYTTSYKILEEGKYDIILVENLYFLNSFKFDIFLNVIIKLSTLIFFRKNKKYLFKFFI